MTSFVPLDKTKLITNTHEKYLHDHLSQNRSDYQLLITINLYVTLYVLTKHDCVFEPTFWSFDEFDLNDGLKHWPAAPHI